MDALNDDQLFAAFILDKVNKLDVQVADLPPEHLNRQEKDILNALVGANQRVREKAFQQDLMGNRECPLKNLLAFANVIHRHPYGNCLELAILGFGLAFSEMLRPGARPRSLAIIFFGGKEQSHFAFTIGDSPNQVICDPWAGILVRESDLNDLQKYLEEEYLSDHLTLLYAYDRKHKATHNYYFKLALHANEHNLYLATCQAIKEQLVPPSPNKLAETIEVAGFWLVEDLISPRQFNYYQQFRDTIRAIGEDRPIIDRTTYKVVLPQKRLSMEEVELAASRPMKKSKKNYALLASSIGHFSLDVQLSSLSEEEEEELDSSPRSN
jgi:hypothetical protein